MFELPKRYVRRKRDSKESPKLVMEIVRKKSRAYELRHFSILKLRELKEFHKKRSYPRKWFLSKDEKRLILE